MVWSSVNCFVKLWLIDLNSVIKIQKMSIKNGVQLRDLLNNRMDQVLNLPFDGSMIWIRCLFPSTLIVSLGNIYGKKKSHHAEQTIRIRIKKTSATIVEPFIKS
jgi:hypothetical protein